MKIEKLRVNHIKNPLGFLMEKLVFSWIVTEFDGKHQRAARICIAEDSQMKKLLYDSGWNEELSSLGAEIPFCPQECTRYYWTVEVLDDAGRTGKSKVQWFETAKGKEEICGKWIGSPYDSKLIPAFVKNAHPTRHPIFLKKISVKKEILSARAYVTALGLFEFYVNGQKAGDEYLTPYFTDYRNWLQYITLDITEMLETGDNVFGVLLGNGWYKGRFGFVNKMKNLYGSRFQLLAEIRICYIDGTMECIGTDNNWLCTLSDILESSIYNGEVIDRRKQTAKFAETSFNMKVFQRAVSETGCEAVKLTPRLSPPLRIQERRRAKRILCTPKGEVVLDFGQIMTGWVEFESDLKCGEEVLLQYGELLQEGNFYNGNLRTAKQEFRYISAGKPERVRPHFTYYGFRYVKIVGISKPDIEDFEACVIHTDMDETGWIETSNEKVNQLIENTKWGLKGNFLDIPTDCPQRDERMGWTGDAQVFCASASFHRYTPAFYRKYLYDMRLSQQQLNGSVPYVIPDTFCQIKKKFKNIIKIKTHGSCGWGDAATIIPWTMYLFYGDITMLREQYAGMRDWVEYIHSEGEKQGNEFLWKSGFHFADWLALDNPDKKSNMGGTDPYYVASAYYFYSVCLTAMAAERLGIKEDAIRYFEWKEKIIQEIQKEYFETDGTLKVVSQTAYVLALHFRFIPEEYREKIVQLLKEKLDENQRHLNTGFVGTAYICQALSLAGLDEYSYTLLLNEEYPGWLYEVNLGATTIWERWNSLLPDGKVSDAGMNSMNHYAYGAVVEWIYRFVCGLNPSWEKPGFKKAVISIHPDRRIEWVKMKYDSANGRYEVAWEWRNNRVICNIVIPFDAEAEFYYPEGAEGCCINERETSDALVHMEAGKHRVCFTLK